MIIVTKIVTFMLDATTVIPALRSFCLFYSIRILAIFIYTLTFFTACMVLDQRRIDERRNGWAPNKLSSMNLVNRFFANLAAVMSQNMVRMSFFSHPFHSFYQVSKLLATCTAICLFGLRCYGIAKLEQRFEERWLIPNDLYLAK